MALRMQREQGGAWRFELLPNRSSSWVQTKRFLVAAGLLNGLIASGFASFGLWLVAPFSGLEVLAFWAGLYVCSRASYRREVILLDADRVVVLRGHDRLESRDEFPRAWARVTWEPVRAGRASSLRLGSHGRFFWDSLPPGPDRLAAHRHNLLQLMLAHAASATPLAVALHAANVERDRLRQRRMMLTDAVAQLLPQLACQVHGIWCAQDVLYASRLALIGQVLATAPGCQGVAILPGAGHWVAFEAAAAFNAALATALAGR